MVYTHDIGKINDRTLFLIPSTVDPPRSFFSQLVCSSNFPAHVPAVWIGLSRLAFPCSLVQ